MKYAIWDKQTEIITPIGEVLSPEEWMQRYPMARLDRVTVVCAAGEINGGYFGTLGQLEQLYTGMGADFSSAATPEEKLAVIEAFEDAREEAAANAVSVEERTAAALELLAMTSLPDEEVEA